MKKLRRLRKLNIKQFDNSQFKNKSKFEWFHKLSINNIVLLFYFVVNSIANYIQYYRNKELFNQQKETMFALIQKEKEVIFKLLDKKLEKFDNTVHLLEEKSKINADKITDKIGLMQDKINDQKFFLSHNINDKLASFSKFTFYDYIIPFSLTLGGIALIIGGVWVYFRVENSISSFISKIFKGFGFDHRPGDDNTAKLDPENGTTDIIIYNKVLNVKVENPITRNTRYKTPGDLCDKIDETSKKDWGDWGDNN